MTDWKEDASRLADGALSLADAVGADVKEALRQLANDAIARSGFAEEQTALREEVARLERRVAALEKKKQG